MNERTDVQQDAARERRVLGLRGGDLIVLLVSILLLLAVMWFLNRWLFPDGTGLDPSTGQRVAKAWNTDKARREFSVAGGAGEAQGTVATLSRVQRAVKIRPADDLAWTGADTGTGLFNRDAVQTLARSSAVIAFGAGNRIELGERSLVVIQTSARDAFVPQRRSLLSLHSGELNGALAAHGAQAPGSQSEDLEIELPFGRLRVFGGDAARFRIGVNPDDSTTVSIFGGAAELHAAGRSVRIAANQGVTFKESDTELVVRQLPDAPRATGPSDSRIVRYGDLPPLLRFTWRGGAGDTDFRFVLARDAEFDDIVLDRRLRTSELSYDNLEDGRYFWKVSALRGWHESPPSAVRRIALERDIEPPTLAVDSGSTQVRDGIARISGRAEPGARVTIAGTPIAAQPNGRFEHTLALEPGANLVVIQAIDDVGNIAYESQILYNVTTHTVGELQ